jgi:hypothetical protein
LKNSLIIFVFQSCYKTDTIIIALSCFFVKEQDDRFKELLHFSLHSFSIVHCVCSSYIYRLLHWGILHLQITSLGYLTFTDYFSGVSYIYRLLLCGILHLQITSLGYLTFTDYFSRVSYIYRLLLRGILHLQITNVRYPSKVICKVRYHREVICKCKIPQRSNL